MCCCNLHKDKVVIADGLIYSVDLSCIKAMNVGKLIDLVRENPILYDYCHPTYKDAKERDKTWKELATSLNISSDVLKMKWKNLRDSYLKHLKSKNMPIGQTPGKYRFWQWAKQMEFMEPYLGFAQTMSNLQSNSSAAQAHSSQLPATTESEEEIVENPLLERLKTEDVQPTPVITECHSSASPLRQPRKRTRLRSLKSVPEPTSTSDKVQHIKSTNPHSLDAIEHILLGYAKTIKTFSPRRQVEIKMKFAKIMMNAELQQIEETSGNLIHEMFPTETICRLGTPSPNSSMRHSDSFSQYSSEESTVSYEVVTNAENEQVIPQ